MKDASDCRANPRVEAEEGEECAPHASGPQTFALLGPVVGRGRFSFEGTRMCRFLLLFAALVLSQAAALLPAPVPLITPPRQIAVTSARHKACAGSADAVSHSCLC